MLKYKWNIYIFLTKLHKLLKWMKDRAAAEVQRSFLYRFWLDFDSTCHCQVMKISFQKTEAVIRWVQYIILPSRKLFKVQGKGPSFPNLPFNFSNKSSVVQWDKQEKLDWTISKILWRPNDTTAYALQMTVIQAWIQKKTYGKRCRFTTYYLPLC